MAKRIVKTIKFRTKPIVRDSVQEAIDEFGRDIDVEGKIMDRQMRGVYPDRKDLMDL